VSAPTPGQTVGPFFGFALPYAGGGELVPPTRPDAIRLHGRVLDGAGEPVPDALVELRQTAPDGSVPRVAGSLARDGYTFTGWGRAATDRTGRYQFSTLRPGGPETGRAPYFALTIFARGLLDRLFTRAYLPGAAPATWPGLEAEADDRGFVFDIRLQGEGETVFLSYTRD
jgi:protocatechuate 3,4-dioxygenase, alpha subunit